MDHLSETFSSKNSRQVTKGIKPNDFRPSGYKQVDQSPSYQSKSAWFQSAAPTIQNGAPNLSCNKDLKVWYLEHSVQCLQKTTFHFLAH